jgi:hypothetical protein
MNKIIFSPNEAHTDLILEHVPPPVLGTTLIPKWFKDAPRYQNNDKEMKVEGAWHNLTVRHCMPFLDAITSGYFMTTWIDMYISWDKGVPKIAYPETKIVEAFGVDVARYQAYFESNVPSPSGSGLFNWAWSTYWRVKTEPGVSCLFTHPMNRPDLPFRTLSGVTDTDQWYGSDVLNFALDEGFEGLIPKGTPIVQIIPFTRHTWDAQVSTEVNLEHKELRDKVNDLRMNQTTSGYYRDNLHTRKRY